MKNLNDFIDGKTEINFGACKVVPNFDLEHALQIAGWDGKDLMKIMFRLHTEDDFAEFLWIVKNLVAYRIDDLTENLKDVCSAFTK